MLLSLLSLLLSNIDIVSFDDVAADEYGIIRSDLEKKGTPIGPLDTMIAAHAKALGYTLVTNNVEEFSRVKGLIVENWAA
ncbi:PIN domain-containing protein [Butyrivibrio sp. AE2032]|uniref:PIN domain-containing protein n=1 Tax=Butyrivibrio sp. AE2032 TaxID=1458463 RepID=UPI0006906700|nr:PIN domain-containing protein [Butyrivibrio sp. AE2032]